MESSESTESNDDEDEEKDAKPNKRNKFLCPLRGCGYKVYKLPRHLKNVHGWSAERARNAVNQFDMRNDQRKLKKPKEVRNKRRRRVCCEWAQAKVSIKTLTEAGRVHTRHKEVLEGS